MNYVMEHFNPRTHKSIIIPLRLKDPFGVPILKGVYQEKFKEVVGFIIF